MTGRERIEQAAKENGWSRQGWGDWSVRYERGNHQVLVTYSAKGTASTAKFGIHGVKADEIDKAGQVIAYLQQHKESN